MGMNKNHISYYYSKKNKVPVWFKYAPVRSKRNTNTKKEIKELFINDFFREFHLENFNLLNDRKNNTTIFSKKNLEITMLLQNPFEINIKIVFYRHINNIDKENIRDLILSWFLIGKNGGYQSYNFKYINQKTKWIIEDSVSDEISCFLTLSYIKFDKDICNIKYINIY